MGSQASAPTSAKKKTPEPDIAAAPAVAAATRDQERTRRKRRTKADMLGRGYEYVDLGDDTGQGAGGWPTATASDRGAGTLGFAGTTRQKAAAEAAGLTTLEGDAFGDDPREPMLPQTWGSEQQPGSRDDQR
jgi:PPE-repeat protein